LRKLASDLTVIVVLLAVQRLILLQTWKVCQRTQME